MKRHVMLTTAAILVLAGCTPKAPGSDQGTAPTPGEQGMAEQMGEFGELAAAIQAGKPVSCAITDDQGVTAQYAFKDGKTRIDGMSLEEGNQGSMIQDGEYAYMWTQGETEGIKFSLTQEDAEETLEETEEYRSQVPDFSDPDEAGTWEDQGYTVDCTQQSIDNDRFVPPADVTFTDVAATMKANMEQFQNQMGDSMDDLSPEMQQQMQDVLEGLGQ